MPPLRFSVPVPPVWSLTAVVGEESSCRRTVQVSRLPGYIVKMPIGELVLVLPTRNSRIGHIDHAAVKTLRMPWSRLPGRFKVPLALADSWRP